MSLFTWITVEIIITLFNLIEAIFVQMKKTIEWLGWNILIIP